MASDLTELSVVERVSEPSAEHATGCQMSALLEFLTRPWTLHILWLLSTKGPMRFGAMKRSVEGISARLLTLRLRSLEGEGFVRRTVLVNGNSHEVTYSPTSRAADMDQVMQLLHALSKKWREGDKASDRAN